MERLTDCAQGYCEMYCKKYGHCFGDPGDCIFQNEVKMYEALKDFEGIVTIDHLCELVQAEKDGKDAQELYRAALDTWGADAQTVMVFEEMSELQKELCKHARGKDNRESIADEIADVWIMLEQMMLLHDCGQIVIEHKAAKLKRLAGRLNCAAEAALKGGDNG